MTPASAIEALRRALRTFRERLLAGFSWNLLSIVALQGSVLLTSILVARLIGLEDFGTYAVLVSTVSTVAGVAQGGTGLVATKFVGELVDADPPRVARILRMCALTTSVTGVVCAAALFLSAPALAHAWLGKPQLEPYLRWVAIAIVFQVVVAYQHGALLGFGAFSRLTRAGVLTGALHLGVTVAGARVGGLQGAVIGLIVATICRAALFAHALRHTRRDHAIPAPMPVMHDDWRLVWTFALPASLAGLVTLPCLWGVTVLVARQPDGLAWVALFSVAHQIRQAVLQLPALLNMVSFSVLSRLKGQGNETVFGQVFWSNLLVGLAFTGLIVLALSLLAGEVLSLFGAQFVQGRLLLLVLLMSALPELIAGTAYQLVQTRGRMWHSLLMIVLPRDLGYLALAFALLGTYALVGAGAAYLAAQVLGAVLTVLLVRVTRDARPQRVR